MSTAIPALSSASLTWRMLNTSPAVASPWRKLDHPVTSTRMSALVPVAGAFHTEPAG